MCWYLVYRQINEAVENLPDYKIEDNIKETEFNKGI